jgi:DMSO/TMAO reductase YedYZ molybdopterin-dependent catalytic subunit
MMSDEEKPGIVGQIKDKLIKSKEKWAQDGRLLTGKADTKHENRLPPGQRLVNDWPVLDLGIQPDIRPQNWRLQIVGLVENPVTWNWQDFQAEDHVSDISDMHCVTAWSRFDNHWQGVSAQHILSLVKPSPQARHVIFHSADGYTTNVTLEVFSASDVLLVDQWEGKPIPREHGGPVRIIIPQYYLWKSAKWITAIEFVADDKPGFWEVRGYHNEGDPWKEDRYS